MNPTRILIVGAGAAGVAATARLLENGIQDIIVLEAENRIGGRVFTSKFGKDWNFVWIHR